MTFLFGSCMVLSIGDNMPIVSKVQADKFRQKIIGEVSTRILNWLVDPLFFDDGEASPEAYVDHALSDIRKHILKEMYTRYE